MAGTWSQLEQRIRNRGVPPAVWTLATLYVGGGIGCLLGVAFPLSDQAPTELNAMVATIGLLGGAGLWLMGARVSDAVLQAGAVLATAFATLLVANAKTSGGATVTAFAYLWVCVYVAHFFTPAAVRVHSLLISLGFGIGLLINEIPHMLTAWIVVTATVVVAGAVLSHVSSRLRDQARTDPLTGVLNRHGMELAATREFALAGRTQQPLCVAVIDLDGFKAVNDSAGHATGDRILVDLTRAWRDRLRASDVLARAGGDEFVLVLPGTDRDAGERLLGDLRSVSSTPWSAGLEERRPGDDFESCMVRADHALYEAKNPLRSVRGRGTALPGQLVDDLG